MRPDTLHCPLQQRRCGGCARLSVPYGAQLRAKQRRVEALFPGAKEILAANDPLHYRNKIISAFAHDQDGLISGPYVYGTHFVLPMADCLLENERAHHIAAELMDILRARKIRSWDEDKRTGLVRYSQVRFARQTGQALVTIVTASPAFPEGPDIARELKSRCPEVRSVIQNINPRAGSAVLGFQEKRLLGDGYIEDQMCGLTFCLSSRAFYQVNSAQAERLYQEALSLCRLTPDDRLADVYCGIGIIGLIAASQVRSVTGIELNGDAIRLARQNAEANHVQNATFHNGDASVMKTLSEKPTVVILDPPRSGCDTKTISALVSQAPERICYISCNIATQARDVRALTQAGYQVHAVQPVDLFPMTDHVESVILMSRVKG
ncbi:MAG: 23S rRNA (uracil(1939)-C(5))-methyltransferase RlmD [Clostridia bacterium]|nr:23S rRNA (uracil(1939)-C(5))-methyltransferase RlmD [Clostridia bacterium]